MSESDIDLFGLRLMLSERFRDHAPRGYVLGKTALRQAIVEAYGCSELDAETWIDVLEANGSIRYGGDVRGAVDDLDNAWVLD